MKVAEKFSSVKGIGKILCYLTPQINTYLNIESSFTGHSIKWQLVLCKDDS
jgi:hypothetical protein